MRREAAPAAPTRRNGQAPWRGGGAALCRFHLQDGRRALISAVGDAGAPGGGRTLGWGGTIHRSPSTFLSRGTTRSIGRRLRVVISACAKVPLVR